MIEYTSSWVIIEVKQPWAWLVFGWVIAWNVKIDINICEPHYVNLFFVDLLHGLNVWLFDIWHLFWQLDTLLQLKPPQPVTGLFLNILFHPISDADTHNDLKSTERKLDSKLILLIKQKLSDKSYWCLPTSPLLEGHSMRQVKCWKSHYMF